MKSLMRLIASIALLSLSTLAGAQVNSIPAPNQGFFDSKEDTQTFYKQNANSKVVIIFLPGGPGSFGLKPDSNGPRSFGMFDDIARGLNSGPKLDYVFMDSPYVLSPSNSKDLSIRATKDHMDRIRSTIDLYKNKTNKPIWLLGHSNGAYSLAEFINQTPDYEKLIAGAIFSSGRNERDIRIDPINLPILVLHHEEDSCQSTTFGAAQSFYERVKSKNRSRTEFVAIKGGTNTGEACFAPTSHHMYGGSYEQFTNAIQQFIFK
jgi:hypothetical protein